MINKENFKLRYYYKDTCTALVTVVNGVVSVEKYTDDWLDLPFGDVPDRLVNRRVLQLFFEEHCIPEHRANLQDFLKHYGLEKFDAFKICRITGGKMADNDYHFEWLDEA